jgi:hypothetical protein
MDNGFNAWPLGAEALRGLTCYHGHYCLYDQILLREYFEFIGFSKVIPTQFGIGTNVD